MNDLDLARFCHWMLTMSEAEAKFISKQCAEFRDDKERVAAFTVAYWKDTRR